MRIIVLGAGVVGVATAYCLARDGHEVTVVDRQPGPARETSFSNAGLVAPGHVYAWASPRAPAILLQSLWREDTALRFRLRLDPALWLWSLRFLANCTAARNRRNTLTKLRLALFSRDELHRIAAEAGIDCGLAGQGALYLYRDKTHLATGFANSALLRDHGLAIETADPDRCVELEPALGRAKDKLAGGLYCPLDESGDCHLFTERLASAAARLGVAFSWETRIDGLATERDRVVAAETNHGRFPGDAFVLALGSYSAAAAGTVGIRLPVYPVKGYSLTIPIEEHTGAPRIPGVDEAYLVAFARLGDRLRLTATADFAGYDTRYTPGDFAPMLKVARELFPNGGAYDRPSYSACLRPMTPDGPPILGKTRFANLWLNTGQGHMGWTMACGSARILSELIARRPSPVALEGMTAERF
ncbi:MAG: D-amino acid dehydrogenase [Rhodospirillales bacterium]|nr:D-amino acid dehydrogenase [Rhodospirillales bacterium]